jgi:hypothetical protein
MNAGTATEGASSGAEEAAVDEEAGAAATETGGGFAAKAPISATSRRNAPGKKVSSVAPSVEMRNLVQVMEI